MKTKQTALDLAREIHGMCQNGSRTFVREATPEKVQEYFGVLANEVAGLIAEIEREHGNAVAKIAEAQGAPVEPPALPKVELRGLEEQQKPATSKFERKK